MIKCLGYPLTLGLVLALLIFFLRKNSIKEKYVLICFIIALLWRAIIDFRLMNLSYRYYNVIILMGCLIVVSEFASRKKTIAITALSVIALVQIYILYTGNKKEYI